MQYSSNILDIIRLAVEAGGIIMKHYKTNMLVQKKSDNSPVTIADIEADEFIFNGLKKITPNVLVISEEGLQKEFKKFNDNPQNYPESPKDFWLVDPIDGTKSFIRGEKEWTVNIALVENNQSVFGVIYAPALGKLFFTDENFEARELEFDNTEIRNFEAFIKNSKIITVNKKSNLEEGYRILASKNHRNQQTEDYINSIKVKEFIPTSSSYKFCLLAIGRADLYPRFGYTMLWDTAAGQAILEAAGGKMFKAENGKPSSKMEYHFSFKDVSTLKNSHFIAHS